MKDRTKKTTEPQPMDAGAKEDSNPGVSTNSQRACWALKTLVNEVLGLFPETPVEYSNYDGRNTALDATFDLTALDADTDRIDLPNLLGLLGDSAHNEDIRLREVLISKDEDGQPEYVLVGMVGNARTQDLREPFGLADALDILAEPGYENEDDADEQGSI